MKERRLENGSVKEKDFLKSRFFLSPRSCCFLVAHRNFGGSHLGGERLLLSSSLIVSFAARNERTS
ncbi:hypothetical protein KY290_014788 [Solanum tuberosum]|uniref:Uncharacterized protein n=1 Tax=Solanum tuberosum TaxID=4113 RepID=A0ABQ7VTB7_SOLTU|nr:hypothetical protein KY290_014788 [Solanum tuberosum]